MTSRTGVALSLCAALCACGGPESFHGGGGLIGGSGGSSVGPAGMSGGTGGSGHAGIGSAGSAGMTALAGSTGAAGLPGTAGVTAGAGSIGSAGSTATAGSTGSSGPGGASGSTGGAGSAGAAGSIGAAGIMGKAGNEGSAGAMGAAGRTGAAGATGAAGTTGVAGATGAAGTTGAAGMAGPIVKIDAGSMTPVAPFVADIDFLNGGLNAATTSAIDRSGVTNPAPEAVYQTGRVGGFTYTIPGYVAGSTHTVRLHFCETYFPPAAGIPGVGQRICNVTLNGTQVLTAYDIFAKAGAQNKAIVEQFTVPANGSGAYVIQFAPTTDQCLVSALEVQ
jgi:hypothetical protein